MLEMIFVLMIEGDDMEIKSFDSYQECSMEADTLNVLNSDGAYYCQINNK